jgi:uncharacterized membrane protein
VAYSFNFVHASLIDGIALFLFFVLWVGYARYHRWKGMRVPSLMGTMHAYRHDWMTCVLQREQRIVDASLLANLANSATFFASTTLLILGALLAMLGTKEKVASVVADLPFATRATEELWEFKIVLLLLIFIYAFFLFTWSLRQFNFASILVGAAPGPGASVEEAGRFVQRAGRLLSLAGDSFNNGLRAYYFALAALMWFVHAWLMIAATAIVVFILYWREFRSDTLSALTVD